MGKTLDFAIKAASSKTDECILWPYAKVRGYGKFTLDDKSVSVHRFVCERVHGPAPAPDMHAAHSCRNRHCVNPRHLRWATPTENRRDRIKDGTHNAGEDHGRAVLDENDVHFIRWMDGFLSHRELAEVLGVSRSTVQMVASGVTWAHV